LKYVRNSEGSGRDQWLFDLAQDVGESIDLKAKRPRDADRLEQLLEDWEADVKPIR
jgi:hypothetical protein